MFCAVFEGGRASFCRSINQSLSQRDRLVECLCICQMAHSEATGRAPAKLCDGKDTMLPMSKYGLQRKCSDL